MALYVDDEPDAEGRYGGALLFVRWNTGGDAPAGHVETEHLVWGDSALTADAQLRELTLHDVKDALDRAIAARSFSGPW